MAQQVRLNNTNLPFILGGEAVYKAGAVLAQDAGRSGDLVCNTVMGKIAASGKWAAYELVTATDGTAIPQGIYRGPTILEATIQAGDVDDVAILVGGLACLVDESQLVYENSYTRATVITLATEDLRTIEDHLAVRGIFMADVVNISDFENA